MLSSLVHWWHWLLVIGCIPHHSPVLCSIGEEQVLSIFLSPQQSPRLCLVNSKHRKNLVGGEERKESNYFYSFFFALGRFLGGDFILWSTKSLAPTRYICYDSTFHKAMLTCGFREYHLLSLSLQPRNGSGSCHQNLLGYLTVSCLIYL